MEGGGGSGGTGTTRLRLTATSLPDPQGQSAPIFDTDEADIGASRNRHFESGSEGEDRVGIPFGIDLHDEVWISDANRADPRLRRLVGERSRALDLGDSQCGLGAEGIEVEALPLQLHHTGIGPDGEISIAGENQPDDPQAVGARFCPGTIGVPAFHVGEGSTADHEDPVGTDSGAPAAQSWCHPLEVVGNGVLRFIEDDEVISGAMCLDETDRSGGHRTPYRVSWFSVLPRDGRRCRRHPIEPLQSVVIPG